MIKTQKTWVYCIVVIFFGLLLRFIFLPNPGFEADVSFWKSWGLGVADGGIVWAAHNTNNNYPTPFAYLLGAVIKVYSFFANPHNFNEFWSNTNLTFLTVAKLPSVIADFTIFAIFIWIGKNAKRLGFPTVHRFPESKYPDSGNRSFFQSSNLYLPLAAFYLLNPVGIIDGAWWGQVDSVGVVIFLLAFGAALTKRPTLAGFFYIVSVMTKLQNMIYGPLFFLFLWQSMGYTGLLRSVFGAAIGFLGLNIEFFLARDMGRVIDSLTSNYDYFPWMSLNAYNLWWIVSGGHGMQVSDKLLAIGIANAKTVGLFVFSSFYLFACLKLAASNEKIKIKSFLEGLIVVNASFFLFQTQSHDRYALPLTVFLLLWAPFFINSQPTIHNSQLRKFSLFYILFSIFYFYNLHTSLVVNYPNNGLPILSSLIQPFPTIVTSILLITFFLIFLFVVIKKSPLFSWAIPVIIFFLALLSRNLPLVLKKPVSLTKFTPYISEQGYGIRTTNMPVNAGFGIPKWSPLSDQYAFYRTGIGTHANSRMDFDIGKHFRTFSTDYGIDTEAGEKGTAMFEVYGDGKKLFASSKIGRFDLPRHAQVDVTGVKILGLVTTDAGDGNTDDHTDWLNPLLFP